MPDPHITLKKMQIADQRWKAAIEESAFAPPDSGFADRLRSIAAAAQAEAAILLEAATESRLAWQPSPKASATKRLTYELRPGGNRPGPYEMWERFDAIVAALAAAQAGTDFAPIATGFSDLSEILAELAAAIDMEHGLAGARKAS
jgi:hypothetical protein